MPVLDGYQATEKIRSLDRKDSRTVPIIALTADAFPEDVQKALDTGMNAHVAKPIDLDILHEQIGRHVKRA
jgi:CheY-like chemotaxis protein